MQVADSHFHTQLKEVREENPSIRHKEPFSLAVAGWSLMSDEEKAAWRPIAASHNADPQPSDAHRGKLGSDDTLGKDSGHERNHLFRCGTRKQR